MRAMDAVFRELLGRALERSAAGLEFSAALKEATGDPSRCRLVRVGGGDISQVYRVELPGGRRLAFKWHADPPEGLFESEKEGLEALAQPGALKIPRVLAWSRHGLLMEWLDPRPAAGGPGDAGAALGRGLAALHRAAAERFGFLKDNFIGLLPQKNTWNESWTSFYRDQRLVPQLEIAARKGRLTPERRARAQRLLDSLSRWIDDQAVQPSLLHGDLWHGNWLDTVDGPALIDPAVYYGDREIDLAMAALFGGFPRSFWQAYQEAFPLRPGWEERRPLYQLYYLLIHLNHFGEAYGPAVDRILARYGR